MILSVALLAAIDGGAKIATQELHPFQVVFLRNFFGATALAPFFFRYGFRQFRSNRAGFHALRGVIHVISMLSWFTAVSILPLAEATALSFTLPMYASVGAIVFLGEPNRLNRWISIAVGIIGMLIIIRPGFIPISAGVGFVVISTIGAAAVKVMTKSLASTDAPLTILGYMTALLAIFSLLPALFVWKTPSLMLVGLTAVMGVTGTFAHYLITIAYRDGELTIVEPMTFARLVWAALFGFLLFGEVPEIWTRFGSAVIVAGAVYLARIEVMLARETRAYTKLR